MSEIKFYYLSWEKLHQLCFALLKKIEKRKLQFDRIICIARGGMVVARIFSDFLDLPISNFTIVSYIRVGRSSKPKVIEPLGVEIKNEKILLVDEIIDHGVTLKKAIAYLQRFRPKKIISLAPIIKPWATIEPDFWQLKISKWVIFPYEIRETIEDMIKLWQKDGLSKEKIKEKLIKIGLPQKKIDYFYK